MKMDRAGSDELLGRNTIARAAKRDSGSRGDSCSKEINIDAHNKIYFRSDNRLHIILFRLALFCHPSYY